MSTAGGIPGGTEKGEVHAETPQPIDLAHGHGHSMTPHPLHGHTTHVLRTSSPGSGGASVVQIRPVRTFLTPAGSIVSSKGGVSLPVVSATAHHQSILLNRSGPNLTILPRGTAGQLGVNSLSGVVTSSPNISTLQFARGTILGNVRPSLNTSGQPTSITVTPISAANFGTSIRLGSPVNNGSWIQTTGTAGTTFSSVRPTTIQVTSRPIHPDARKIIHIPQGGTVPHLTQLHVVDTKGSVLKPTTPISVRGTVQQQGAGNNATGITLSPLAPFSIRAATIQRPPSVITTTSQAQKVITQPAHGPPIIVNQNQKFTQIQNFSTLPRIPVISISTANGGTTVITGTNASIVGVSPRQSAPNIMMSSSGSGTGQLTKVYPISREVNTSLVETYINQGHVQVQPHQNHLTTPTLSVVPNSSTPPAIIRPTFVISSSNASSIGAGGGQSTLAQTLKGITSPAHQMVQIGSPLTSGGPTTSNYYIEPKNLPTNVSIFPHSSIHHPKRISIESPDKKEKGLVTSGSGQMIFTPTSVDADLQAGGLSAQFAHPIPIQTQTTNQITAHPLSLPKGTPLSLPYSQISITPHSIPTNVISPAIITTSVTTTTSTPTALTTTNTSIVTLSISSGAGGPAISTIITSTTISPPISGSISSTSANTPTSLTSTPAQSPSQSKATLSPRPSILRKREAGVCETNFVPLRAQRNLTVNFSAMGPVGAVGSLPTGNPPPPPSPNVIISTVSNKENNSNNNSSGVFGNFGLGGTPPSSSVPIGVSILKKEFQPPNEESSWQSCSSNSSSGSTTLSATSDTTEAPEAGQLVGGLGVNPYSPVISTASQPTNLSGLVITRTPPNSLPLINLNPIQNGIMVRSRGPPPSAFARLPSSVSIVSGTHPTPARHRATSVGKGRELKGRKEAVSPRKKPRKQQLTTSDFIESSSPEISFYQSKRFKRNETGKIEKPPEQGAPPPPPPPEPPEERIFYLLRKPRASLFKTNKFVPNFRHNHFKRYSDVKPKDERRPTISDLANQKNVLQKIGGWKLKHLSKQMDQVVESEVEVVQHFNRLMSEINSEEFMSSGSSSRDLSRIEDLLKGNLQRCKVVKDQITESKSQVSKVLEHHSRILDVIKKHISKRPVKKREISK